MKYAAKTFCWTPEDGLLERKDRDRAPYDQWVRDGYLLPTPGKTIHYGWVAEKIGELCGKYDIKAIAFDRWRIDDLQRELDDRGIDVELIPHGQGFKDMNPAVECLEDMVKDRTLMHGNNPILNWAVANVRISRDPAGARKFDKKESVGRIDPAVATAMAANIATFQPEDTEASISFVTI